MKRIDRLIMTAALAACFPLSAYSQQPGTGEAGTSTSPNAPPPDANSGSVTTGDDLRDALGATLEQRGYINPTPWFADPATRAQLRLNNAQYARLKRLYDAQYRQYQQRLAQQLRADLDAEQSATRRRELRQQFHRDLSNRLDTEFQDDEFRTRFRQLNRQFQGYGAFANPDIQEDLKLTAQQRARLNRMDADWDRRVQQLMSRHRNNPEQLQQEFAELQRARARQVESVLAPEQLEAWNGMIGDRFDFPATTYIPGESQSVEDALRLRGRGPDGVTRPGTSTVPDVSP